MWPIFCPEVDDSVGSSQDFPCKTHEDESQKFLPLSRILSIPGILGLAKFEPQSNYSTIVSYMWHSDLEVYLVMRNTFFMFVEIKNVVQIST